MFIRETIKKHKGSSKKYRYHRLVESIRTESGPRQTTVLDLGQLELPKEKWKLLANRIEEITSGASRRLFPVEPEIEALAQHYASVLLKNRLKEKKSAEKKEPRYEI